MTIGKLYQWSIENGYENLPLRIFKHEEGSITLYDISIEDNVHTVGKDESKAIAIQI